MMLNAWDVLVNYESQELVRRRYLERHRREANAALACEICACITQGISYFKSAESSDRAVRPLLLYYGVLSLARGAAIFLRPGRRESSLSQAHGLQAVGWGATLADPKRDVGDLQVRVAATGSMLEFADATAGKSLLRMGQSVITMELAHDAHVPGQEFTLADVLSRLPEVAEQYSRWRPDGRCALGSVEKASPGGSVVVNVGKRMGSIVVDRARVERVAATLEVLSVEERPDLWRVALRVPLGEVAGTRNVPGVWDYVPPNMLGIGSLCFVARHPDGWLGSKPVALFTLAYILGMLARYHPSRWMSLARNYGHDAGTPTLLSAMSLIEAQFPRMIADCLDHGFEPSEARSARGSS